MTTPIRIGQLDFEDIKASIKQYISKQTEFTDYNFEGSNISQLLNILAYNSHYDALAANFLANEMFLDTATKRSSIVSRAKELGYTPRSRRASSTTLNIKLKNIQNENSIDSIVVPRGTRFSSSVNDESFTFTTKDSVVLNKQIELGSPVFTGSTMIYEGVIVQQTVIYNSTENLIKIPNLDIDTTTLKVEVLEGQQWTEYNQPQFYLNSTSTSPVYLLQEGFEGFEIYFGDGAIGKKPANGSSVRMSYIVTSGDVANGAMNFKLTSNIAGMLSNTVVTLTALQSSGGLIEESTDSIKLNARNNFNTQNRAVIAKDYAILTAQNFSNVKDVLAWDGSDNIPPKFGKVVLCIQPSIGDAMTTADKNVIADFLQKKGVGNVKVDFVDPSYLGLEVESKVKYDINQLKVSIYELEFLVKAAIASYATTSIQKFGGVARYSTLLSTIDGSDFSIVGNETLMKINKELSPNLYSINNFKFSYMNAIREGTLSSSIFYDGIIPNKLYIKDVLGKLHVYYSVAGVDVLHQSNIGTIDYSTGDVAINNLQIGTLDSLKFKLTATTANLDIYSSQNVILKLDQEKVKVKVTRDDV